MQVFGSVDHVAPEAPHSLEGEDVLCIDAGEDAYQNVPVAESCRNGAHCRSAAGLLAGGRRDALC